MKSKKIVASVVLGGVLVCGLFLTQQAKVNADSTAKITVTTDNSSSNSDSSSSNSDTSSSAQDSDSSSSASDTSSSEPSSSSSSTTINNANIFKTPVLAYGGGLNDDQLTDTEKALGMSGNDYKKFAIQGSDVDKYLNQSGSQTSGLFSSVLISRTDAEGQNKVEIVTPKNITSVTQVGYESPLLTAGVSNLDVKVASTDEAGKVTGESALAGVYKALEEEGVKLDGSRMQVAQKELNTTAGIVDNHTTDSTPYKNKQQLDTQLANALAEIKQELAKKNGQNVTNDQIEDIVNHALKDSGLDTKVNSTDKNNLNSLAKTYVDNKDTVLDKKSVSQYKDFAKGVSDQLKDKFGITTEQTEGFFHKVWDAIKSWF